MSFPRNLTILNFRLENEHYTSHSQRLFSAKYFNLLNGIKINHIVKICQNVTCWIDMSFRFLSRADLAHYEIAQEQIVKSRANLTRYGTVPGITKFLSPAAFTRTYLIFSDWGSEKTPVAYLSKTYRLSYNFSWWRVCPAERQNLTRDDSIGVAGNPTITTAIPWSVMYRLSELIWSF